MKPGTRLSKMLHDVVFDAGGDAFRCCLCDAKIPGVPLPMEAEAWVAASNARCLGHMVEHFIEQERVK